MNVLGISTTAAVYSTEQNLKGAIDKSDNYYPKDALTFLINPYSKIDRVLYTDANTFLPFSKYLARHTAVKPILVDEKQALVKSACITKKWDTCAVILENKEGLFLGSYYNGHTKWLKAFKYPQTLQNFISSACTFLSLGTDINDLAYASSKGVPIYADIINKHILSYRDDYYTLNTKVLEDVKSSILNYDIAASVQAVYTDILIYLVTYLMYNTKQTNLALVGSISENILSTTAILNSGIIENLAINPSTTDASAALGAVALHKDILWEHNFIGEPISVDNIADSKVAALISGDIINITSGHKAFARTSMATDGVFAIPYSEVLQKLRKNIGMPSYRPFTAVCQAKDYSKLFQGDISNCSNTINKLLDKRFLVGDCPVVTVSNTSNPYMHRLLEVLKAQGFPMLITVDNIHD